MININREINRLLNFALQRGLIGKDDKIYSANMIIDVLGVDDFFEEEIHETLDNPTEILENILDFNSKTELVYLNMDKKDLRIIFMGTPEFAVESLRTLVETGYNVVAVVTQPDKPVGRHQDRLQPSAVKEYALSKGLPVLQPVKMKDPAFVETLRSYNADLQVVVAFRMLPEVVWAMPRYGTFNVHAALLPQYRGAAPINWAVINGETMTGVTTFFLDKDIDTGRIILQKEFPIPDDADVEYVYDGLMKLGAEAAKETIDPLLGTPPTPEFVKQIDIEARRIAVTPIEGMFTEAVNGDED